MTREEMEKGQRAIEKWRRDHPDIESRREAYRKSIPRQVWASFAFEGEHVSLKMLEEYMETLMAQKDRNDPGTSRKPFHKKLGDSRTFENKD